MHFILELIYNVKKVENIFPFKSASKKTSDLNSYELKENFAT